MKNLDPIILIDDDSDDLSFLKEAVVSLGIKNKVLCFGDSTKALEYLKTTTDTRPFLILCDINMPKMDGFMLRKTIHDDDSLLLITTPFLFLSTANAVESINQAYRLNIQGFFTKPSTFDGLVAMLKNIIAYWTVASSPDAPRG